MKAVREPFKLDQLGSVARGRSRHRPRNDPSLYGGEIPFFQTGDVKAAELYLHNYTQTYNDKGLAQSRLWQPGTVCITIAANIAESAVLSIPGCFPDSVVGFVPYPDKSDGTFIKYYIDTIKLQMQSASRGTTQDNLSLDKLLTFDWVVPEVTEQRRIASILSAYDDLIENNTRRIAILEEMSRRIYEEWFVHFRFPGHEKVKMVESELGMIPEGWKIEPLSAVTKINAKSVRPANAPAEILYVDIASVVPGSITHKQPYKFSEAPGRARRILQHGDVIWSCVRPNRRSYALVLQPEDSLIASTGFAVLSATSVPYSYLYFSVTTDDFVGFLTNHATGAAYPAVTAATFEAAPLLSPEKEIADKFHSVAAPMLDLAEKLKRKNANLRATRDLLLPKLISGELDVSTLPEPEEAIAA